MTPLTREETERLLESCEISIRLGRNWIVDEDQPNPETLRELLRGYEAWRDGIEKIEKEPKLVRSERFLQLPLASGDALRAREPK